MSSTKAMMSIQMMMPSHAKGYKDSK